MSKFRDALKNALRAVTDSPKRERFVLLDKVIVCAHCGGDRFLEGEAQLNTAGMTFLNLDWTNQSATTLTCMECGRLEWFLHKPERTV